MDDERTTDDLDLNISINSTANPAIWEIGGVPHHGKAAVKRALKADASAEIDRKCDSMFPLKVGG